MCILGRAQNTAQSFMFSIFKSELKCTCFCFVISLAKFLRLMSHSVTARGIRLHSIKANHVPLLLMIGLPVIPLKRLTFHCLQLWVTFHIIVIFLGRWRVLWKQELCVLFSCILNSLYHWLKHIRQCLEDWMAGGKKNDNNNNANLRAD